MVDLYHLQHIRGDCTQFIKANADRIGHFQIAQVPDRHEPNDEGELNLKYILKTLENCGYNDAWIGCEYKPKIDSVKGLGWIEEFGYKL
jgi:hydroxypyruvate isomerase